MLKIESACGKNLMYACILLAACTTPTRPSATLANKSLEPSPVFNFQVVNTGGDDGAQAVYRSGQPTGDTQWAYLAKLGIKTIVKLNKFSSESDEAQEFAAAKKHNINVISVYMPPEDFPHNLNLWAHPDEKTLLQAVVALEDKNNLPALVHCSHGKDRTGIVVAVYSIRNKNYCKDAALNEMIYYGTNPLLFGLKPMLDSQSIAQNPGCGHAFAAQ